MTDIRALTVQQPYAWAIACGGKLVENRTRRTHYQGLLAIHAGKAVRRDGMDDPRVLEAIADHDFSIDEAASQRGAVIAVAQVTGCHHAEDCIGPAFVGADFRDVMCSPWAQPGKFHIELTSVRPLADPVPCRGSLGLWRLPGDTEKAVQEQMETALQHQQGSNWA